MQTSILVWLFGIAVLLMGCGVFGDGQKTEKSEPGVAATVAVGARPPAYLGPTSLEERILKSPVIAKVRLESVSTSVETGNTYRGLKPIALLEFRFSVLEYLKGTGANNIVAVWAAPFFDTQQEAEDARSEIAGTRDARWDTHDAIVFLQHSVTYLPTTQQAGRFYFTAQHLVGGVPDDYYSLSSRGNKLWLPAEAAMGAQSQPTGDQQRFLTDMPPAAGTAPTITLGEMKTRIASVTAKLDAGDGSEQYIECLERTYRYEGRDQYTASIGGVRRVTDIPDGKLASGLGASSVAHEAIAYTDASNIRLEVWLEGTDADLFRIEFGDTVPSDFLGADGNRDLFEFAYRVVTARPLPAGTYSTDYNLRDAHFVPCKGYTYRHDWTIPVEAPEDTLHEAFFDPVTDGTAVAADDTNGVLKPATFTDTNSASANLERIAWESGTVKFELSSHDALVGQVANFIELDGTVSLSLNADDATVDAANDTLSWPVASQPWEDGDKLMLRIREAQGTCWNGTAVPNLSTNPGLASDCTVLLAAKDTLRGTATLNWSADTAITSWDGVVLDGKPSRVTEIRLPEKNLDGSVPAELANLTALTDLRLYDNQLSGGIPSELGGLSNLVILYLDGNQLTGAIPTELGSLSNLVALHLDGNQLTGTIPTELGGLSNLRDLFLGKNQLTGGIPTQLGNLSSLSFLNLDGNQLTGAIPTQLGSLTNMQDLSLSNNRLTGGIPTQLGDLTKLRDLFLNGNQLTGSIPTQLGKLANLQVLDLRSNQLTGSIPSELGKLSKLETLYLHSNQLTGAIPAQLGNLTNLATLWLSGNTLTGCIPAALRNVDENDLSTLRLQYCTTP